MKTIFSACLVLSSMTLAGCGGGSGGSSSTSTTTNTGAYSGQNSDGTYTVSIGGQDVKTVSTTGAETLDENGITADYIYTAGSGANRINAVQLSVLTALSGYVNGQAFKEINGTLSRPSTPTASYDTIVYVTSANSDDSAAAEVTLDANFTSNTLTTSTTNPLVNIQGDIAAGGASITGTATYQGSSAEMIGGFYDDGKSVAGAFANDTLHGVFDGDQ